MRTTLIALSFAGCICLIYCQSVGAVPAAPAVVKEAAIGSSTVQQAQYYQRHTRNRISSATENSSSDPTFATPSIAGGCK
jgi:hypothetical protein